MKNLIIFPLILAIVIIGGCAENFEKQTTNQQLSNNQRLPIIDMHMHASSFPSDGIPVPIKKFTSSIITYSAATSDEEIHQLTLEMMDKYNIVLGYLSSNFENLNRWVEADPDRFIPSPAFGKPGTYDIEFLRNEYNAGRIKGIGEIASQFEGISPDDPVLDPYFALAVELDVPFLIHTLGIGPTNPKFRSSLGHPLLLEEVLVRHPDLRLFIEAAGYPFLDEMIALMYQYPQVYADISAISWIIPRETFYDYLEALMRAGLGKRLMFGSDVSIWPETIGMAVEAIESAEFLTEEQKRDIFYNNAVEFLRLDENTLNK